MSSRTARTAIFLAASSLGGLAGCAKAPSTAAPAAPVAPAVPETPQSLLIELVAMSCNGGADYFGGAFAGFEPLQDQVNGRVSSDPPGSFRDGFGHRCSFTAALVEVDLAQTEVLRGPVLLENAPLTLQCGTLGEIAADSTPHQPFTGELTVGPHPDDTPGKKLANTAGGVFKKDVLPGHVCAVRHGDLAPFAAQLSKPPVPTR